MTKYIERCMRIIALILLASSLQACVTTSEPQAVYFNPGLHGYYTEPAAIEATDYF